MREEGFVKTVSGDTCEVIVKRKSACGENCASCSAACDAKEHICVCKNTVGAKAGDKVFVEMDSMKVLKSAFSVYILPILVFLTVFLAMTECAGNDVFSALIATAAGGLVFFVVSLVSKRNKAYYMPEVTEII